MDIDEKAQDTALRRDQDGAEDLWERGENAMGHHWRRFREISHPARPRDAPQGHPTPSDYLLGLLLVMALSIPATVIATHWMQL